MFLLLSVLTGKSDAYIASHATDNSFVSTGTNTLDVVAVGKPGDMTTAARASEMKQTPLDIVPGKGSGAVSIVV